MQEMKVGKYKEMHGGYRGWEKMGVKEMGVREIGVKGFDNDAHSFKTL